MQIKKVLVKLNTLLQSWDLKTRDYVLVDEFAYFLQGYNLNGPEIKGKHLDLYVNPNSLPWQSKKERSIIPPIGSKYMRDYEKFMQSTGYSLDLLVANNEILKAKQIVYRLSDRTSFPIMEARSMTTQFVKRTLLHYSLEDVDKEKILEWLNKLEKIGDIVEGKGDRTFDKTVKSLLQKCRARWTSSNLI